MKKIILLVLSAFTFLILFALGMIALSTNTWGLNFDTSGLFPHMTVTLVEFEGNPLEHTYQELYGLPTDKYYIQNITGDDINIQYNNSVANREGEFYNISLHAENQYLIDYHDNTFTIEKIPDEYDYYFNHGYFYNTTNTRTIQLSIDKYSEQYHNSEQINITTSTATIKDGEKYEIKLP